jgi:hypothetical protein
MEEKMPRIGGINVVGVLLASLVFYAIGYLVYGVFFHQEWLHNTLAYVGASDLDTIRQMSDERLDRAVTSRFPDYNLMLTTGLGLANSIIMVTALAIVLRLLTAAAPSLLAYVGFAILMSIGFSCTSIAMDHIHAYKPLIIMWIDCGYNLFGFMIAAAILSVFD